MLLLAKTKKGLCLQEHPTKDNFLFVTGLHVQLMRLAARMTLLLVIGINKDVLDLLSLWIFYLPMNRFS